MNKKQVAIDISNKPFLTEKEASLFLGISRQTLYMLRTSGKIGFYKEKLLPDKKKLSIRYSKEHLIDYIKENYMEGKSKIEIKNE